MTPLPIIDGIPLIPYLTVVFPVCACNSYGNVNSLEWSGGMEYWSGVLDWTTGVGGGA